MNLRRDLSAWLVGLAAFGARQAGAQMPQVPPCAALVPSAPILYIAGPGATEGSAIDGLLRAVALQAQNFARIVYLPALPCAAIADVSMRMPVGGNGILLDPVAGPTACVPPMTAPDVAFADLSPASCAQSLGFAPLSPLGQLDRLGPIEPVAIVVAAGSPERSISADAAYVVFGFPNPDMYIDGWTDPTAVFVPAKSSGPLNVVAQTIGLDPTHWVGAKDSKLMATTAMIAALQAAPKPASTIGLLPGPIAEHEASVRVLAYQHAGERCGYLPDSDAFHLDKINLREGRYGLWAPIHMITQRDIGGPVLDHRGQPNAALVAILDALAAGGPNLQPATPSDAAASDAAMTDATTAAPPADASPPPSLDPTPFMQAIAQSGFVPWCAMRVSRMVEGDAESSFQPGKPCGCAFESAVGATTSYCTPCQSEADCADRGLKCRFGYCEAQ